MLRSAQHDTFHLSVAGLGEPEILQLVSLKKGIVTGKRSGATAEHKRLLFARYLYEHGALHG
jgi:hypothetical protein